MAVSSHPQNRSPAARFLPLVKLWIGLSVLASLAGWSLSAAGQLNRAGYAVFFAAAGIFLLAAGSWAGRLLPPGIKVVGFVGTVDDCDISLWRPFGARRVEHFLLTDPPEQIRQRVEYAVVSGHNLQQNGLTLETWLHDFRAELVGTTNATLKVTDGMQSWHVVRFKPD
jgi:hypothetical protein